MNRVAAINTFPMDSNPFSKFVMLESLPNNFKLALPWYTYGGMDDPQIYITMFKYMMLLNGAIKPFLCQVFLTSMEKSALLWFSTL